MAKENPTGVALLTTRELATAFDVNERTIRKLVQAGLPVTRRGTGGLMLFDAERAWRWWTDRQANQRERTHTLESARTRKELAQAIEAEQRVAIRAKTLVPAADVEREWTRRIAGYRARMLALPLALTEQVVHAHTTDGMDAAETVMQRAIYQALNELAGGVLPEPPTKHRPRRRPRS